MKVQNTQLKIIKSRDLANLQWWEGSCKAWHAERNPLFELDKK